MGLILIEDSKKLDENADYSEEEKETIKRRLTRKLAFYLMIVGSIVYKAWYHYSNNEMKKKIIEYNKLNREGIKPQQIT